LYEEINYFYGRAASTLGIGNIEFAMENYQIALDFYLTALELANKHNDKYEFSGSAVKAMVYNRLGETYLKLGYLKESANMLKIAADLSDEFDIPANMAKTSLLYSQLYERIKNSELAYQYFKTYNELTDSIINARNVATITKLEMEYQYMKKQKVMSLQQLKKEEEHKRKVLLYELMIGVTVVIMALLILILILYRKNQRGKAHEAELIKINLVLEKENLQKELAFKNKELTTSVMYQLKKNNFIWKISEKLKGIALNLTPENRKSVKSIVKEMEGNMSKESWEEFEFRFNEVHNDFYDNLLRDFPDLTPNELKLCAFLKLNMTTKDIATITYQSTHSITVARYRLRNKLKLERDENLVSFLSKF
jgi:tetratricopeptide (TPR) repeat protein/DNA-binding CsgD family transcriptional regulator